MRLGSRRRVRLARLRDCRSTSWLRVIVCRPGVKHNLEAQLEVGDAAISLPCSRQLPTLTEGLVRDFIFIFLVHFRRVRSDFQKPRSDSKTLRLDSKL